MRLHALNTGNFKLDGGAMFGVVPKSLWEKRIPADENNLCTWALRCMLVEDGNRLVLIDTGIGDKQEEKFFRHYYRSNIVDLRTALNEKGFSVDDVTDVFLTHLHFDHCGGAVNRKSSGGFELALPNATYWSNDAHWNWAKEPNKREKASFLKENILPVEESGQLKMVNPGQLSDLPFNVLYADGHTEKQMLPLIDYKGKKLLYAADLIPSHAHFPTPWVMGYDVRPLLSMDEKESVLNQAAQDGWVIVFEHDATIEACTVKRTEKGVVIDDILNISEL